MILLALDTALGACSACLFDMESREVLARAVEPMDKGHAERLMPMVAEMAEQAGISPQACGRFVATVGPGSFTGLRVALSAARAMATVTGGEVVGVSTLSALAAPWLAQGAAIAVAIDARHDHVYCALVDAAGRALAEPAYRSARDFAELAAAIPSRLVGSGAALVAAHWPKGTAAAVATDPAGYPDIEWVARLGAAADPALAPPLPLYLKPPDAKPQEALPHLRLRGAAP